jgi:addiction module HigA family antidote
MRYAKRSQQFTRALGLHGRARAILPASPPPNRITQIISARRAITGDTALRLGHWFGTNPLFWLTLQSAYDLRIAQQRTGPAIARLPTRSTA